MTIDPLDARLIAALREQPRVGLLEISRQLGVARGTVQARLSKLEGRGVVIGYGPEVDPGAMGYAISAFVLIELNQGRLAEAVELLGEVPEGLEADAISGASRVPTPPRRPRAPPPPAALRTWSAAPWPATPSACRTSSTASSPPPP